MLCHVAAVKHLPVHHYSASAPLGSLSSIKSFENRVPLKPVLGGVAGVAHLINGYEQTQ